MRKADTPSNVETNFSRKQLPAAPIIAQHRLGTSTVIGMSLVTSTEPCWLYFPDFPAIDSSHGMDKVTSCATSFLGGHATNLFCHDNFLSFDFVMYVSLLQYTSTVQTYAYILVSETAAGPAPPRQFNVFDVHMLARLQWIF